MAARMILQQQHIWVQQHTQPAPCGGVHALQVFFSQLPNIEESSWVSLIGALTAMTYSTIALGLSIAKGTCVRAVQWSRDACLSDPAH